MRARTPQRSGAQCRRSTSLQDGFERVGTIDAGQASDVGLLGIVIAAASFCSSLRFGPVADTTPGAITARSFHGGDGGWRGWRNQVIGCWVECYSCGLADLKDKAFCRGEDEYTPTAGSRRC